MSAPVWINGAWDGRLDPFDRGLLLGDGVFDTLVAFGRTPFARARHLERLTAQAGAIGIPLDPRRVEEGWAAILARAAAEPSAEHLILRTTVTRGRTERGLWPLARSEPTVMVSAAPWSVTLMGRPVRLITSAIRRNTASPSSRLKTLGYLDNILAAREAAAAGADDALLLNEAGRAACSTIANLFVIRRGELATPPLSDGMLPGTMRAMVLEAADAVGLRGVEQPLEPADLRQADAVFLTNSVRFVSPVTGLDDEVLSRSAAALVSALLNFLLAKVATECGADPRLNAPRP